MKQHWMTVYVLNHTSIVWRSASCAHDLSCFHSLSCAWMLNLNWICCSNWHDTQEDVGGLISNQSLPWLWCLNWLSRSLLQYGACILISSLQSFSCHTWMLSELEETYDWQCWPSNVWSGFVLQYYAIMEAVGLTSSLCTNFFNTNWCLIKTMELQRVAE